MLAASVSFVPLPTLLMTLPPMSSPSLLRAMLLLSLPLMLIPSEFTVVVVPSLALNTASDKLLRATASPVLPLSALGLTRLRPAGVLASLTDLPAFSEPFGMRSSAL